MEITTTPIKGLLELQLKIFKDSRGFFTERFHADKFSKLGLPTQFVQDNHSRSIPKVLRGLHFQTGPAQSKLVSVVTGRIWDVVVDLRVGSPTFGKSHGVELSADNGKCLWVPKGFAHGFCVLGDIPTDVFYKVDELYSPATDSGIVWNDPELRISWPIDAPMISDKDQALGTFAEYRKNPKFTYDAETGRI